jgi:hypothetical protein
MLPGSGRNETIGWKGGWILARAYGGLLRLRRHYPAQRPAALVRPVSRRLRAPFPDRAMARRTSLMRIWSRGPGAVGLEDIRIQSERLVHLAMGFSGRRRLDEGSPPPMDGASVTTSNAGERRGDPPASIRVLLIRGGAAIFFHLANHMTSLRFASG